MAHNPPPAPDWVMGEDGHWKPPPFVLGQDAPMRPLPGTALPPAAAYAPTSGAGPDAYPGGSPLDGATPMTRPARSTAAIVGMVIGGLGIAFLGLVVVLVLAVTFLGTSSEGEFEAVDMDPNTPGVQNGGTVDPGPYGPVDPADDPSSPGPAAEPAAFCPTAGDVAGATGLVLDRLTPEGYATELDLNGVSLTAEGCTYGSTVSALVLTGPSAPTAIDDLRSASGPFTVTDGARDIPSVDVVTSSSSPSDGAVRVVFEVDGEVYTVARNGQDLASLEPLVEQVRTRVG